MHKYQISWTAQTRTGTANGDIRLDRVKVLDPAALDEVRLFVENDSRIQKGSVVIVSIWKYES